MNANPEGIKALVAFLLGEAPLDGVWFGDAHPDGRGQYWWRRNLRESLTAVAEPEEESRAITALKVTLFETECYLPASIAKRVQAACTVGVAGDAEVVAYISETHAACLAAGKRNGVLVAAEVYSEPAGSLRPLIYGDAAPTRQAVEGMALVPREPTEAAVDHVAHTLWIYEGGSLSWTLLRVKTKYRTLAKHAIASYFAAAAPQAGKE